MSVDKKVTIRDVAEHLGISISSVSRALNNHPYVSNDLRQRVEATARELGYRPDFLAYSLRSGTTRSIGFLVGNMANPVLANYYEGAAEVLATHGYAIMLVSSQNNPDLDQDYLRFLVSRQVNGLIVSSAAGGPDQISNLITEFNIPTVMLDRTPPDGAHVRAVQSDHVGGMRAAVAHLIQQGHRRIALMGGPEHIYPSQARLEGFRRAISDAGLKTDPELVRSVAFKEADAYMETMLMLSRRGKPSAIIAAGNVILTGVLSALQKQGMAVERDIALIGCDDIDLARLHKPPITVVARDLHLIGKTAARLLIDGMDKDGDRVITLPTQLIIRESSNFVYKS